MNSKYSNFLTILLVLIIIAIIGIIGFLGFKYYQTSVNKENSEKFVETFVDQIQNNGNTGGTSSEDNEHIFEGVEGGNSNTSGGNNGNPSSNAPKYNGFLTSGSIEIPVTGWTGPIIAQSDYSAKALEVAVAELYGPGLNQVGNTTISGHNYRNKTFFSDNKKLNIGDKIYITDLSGKRLSYTIYQKFEAEENYADYIVRDTNGAIEISLSTCTDDSKKRLIILAKADV